MVNINKKWDVIVGAGCSFMNGDAILDGRGKVISQLHLPIKYLSKKLGGVQTVNLAESGASNDKIIRKVYNWCEGERGQKKTLIIIGLSELGRFEFKSKEKYNQKTFFDLHPHNLVQSNEYCESTSNKFFKGDKHFKYFIEFWMKWIYDEEYLQNNLKLKIKLLKSYFETNNIDFIIFNSLYSLEDINEIVGERNSITFETSPIWYNDIKEKHIKKYGDWNNQKFRSPMPEWGEWFCDGHPSPNANKELAERIYKKLEEMEYGV